MKNKAGIICKVIAKGLNNNIILSVVMIISIVGAVVMGIIPPLILEKIVDRLTESKEIEFSFIIIYILFLAAAGIFDAAKEALITIFGQKVTHNLRSEMCKKLSRLRAGYYTDNEPGVIVSRFVNDVDTIETLFDSGIISMIADGFKVVSIIVVIFVKSKGLGMLMVFVIPLLMVFTSVVQKRMLQAQLENRVSVGNANNHIPETIRNIRMIHTFGIEKFMEKRYSKYINNSYQAIEKSNFYDAVYSPVIITISAFIVSLTMVMSAMGGEMQSFFGMSAGTAVAIISYVSKVFDPLESIGMEIQNIQSAVAGIYRISDFLNESERTNAANENNWNKELPAIEFENVKFGYSDDKIILDDVSFVVNDKENITLKGQTGAGKSTIFKLILSMYDVWQGNIKVYGVPVQNISDEMRSSIIGYVEQSFKMISGTIKEQITLKDESITEKEVNEALKLVGLDKRIYELPDGINTMCHENLFSQGQIQLLSIARAVVRNPMILLLDEITANLDSVTEKQVLQAINEASSNRTVLAISHRVYEKACGDEKYIEIGNL